MRLTDLAAAIDLLRRAGWTVKPPTKRSEGQRRRWAKHGATTKDKAAKKRGRPRLKVVKRDG